ncbi:Complement component 1 Q subcomponent-binding protein, mitochondrial [Armadillidium nasatum]|uniref:Complement component 1 Q subcomponent-binding protein, mitochondrial n=1 Tax=Armadillidium nasatum TaxID=96803 RepID=A0A5N5TLJ8_9CRUS|nr:Complement component 1 Q subcomponent-binding protein, mitochondrial [Armadillidium nasatum]
MQIKYPYSLPIHFTCSKLRVKHRVILLNFNFHKVKNFSFLTNIFIVLNNTKMSFLTRSVVRLIGISSAHNLSKNIGSQWSAVPLSRSLAFLSTPLRMNSNNQMKHTNLCSCGCGIHGMHTKVSLSLNVNHTVGSNPSVEEQQSDKLTSKPDFEVDVKIGSKTLSFSCQYTPEENLEGEDVVDDKFGISEVTIYDGEWEEKIYGVSGDILDGVMYDLLMNYLDERGINNDFIEKMAEICTNHEHSLYVNMLEKIENFVKRK